MDYYAIGQRIRKFRKARGLSQEQLAESAGISVTHMSHIETGNTKLSLPVLVAISEKLEVQTDELLYDNIRSRIDSIDQLSKTIESCSSREIKLITNLAKNIKSSLDILYDDFNDEETK